MASLKLLHQAETPHLAELAGAQLDEVGSAGDLLAAVVATVP
jgi:hypothetical protein